MARKFKRITASPVVEGVRFEIGKVQAYAVRNESGDITVRVSRTSRFLHNLTGWIPFLRGVVRLFSALSGLTGGLRESGRMDPQDSIRGNRFTRGFASLFRTTPQVLSGLFCVLMIPLILAATLLGLPLLAEWGLMQFEELPRYVINAVCCLFRIVGTLLSVYWICRLRIFRRLCMYRGAAGKVLNAYRACGSGLSHENAVLSSRLTDKSDGIFMILTVITSMIVFACVRVDGTWLQLAFRIGTLLASAAVVNEILRPLEHAGPDSFRSHLRKPLWCLQHLFTLEPQNAMIEVAVCAFRAAYEENE